MDKEKNRKLGEVAIIRWELRDEEKGEVVNRWRFSKEEKKGGSQ